MRRTGTVATAAIAALLCGACQAGAQATSPSGSVPATAASSAPPSSASRSGQVTPSTPSIPPGSSAPGSTQTRPPAGPTTTKASVPAPTKASVPAPTHPSSRTGPTSTQPPVAGSGACALLPAPTVATTIGAREATPAASSQGEFESCAYALATTGGHGTLYLDTANTRGTAIYQAALSTLGFSPVSGVGDAAAYNAHDGRFILRAGDGFVGLTIPVDLAGSRLTTPHGAQGAAVTLARVVLGNLD